jgi:hypothetical protein
MGYTRQERRNQRQWKHGVHKKRKDKPETVETWGTQDKKGQTSDSGQTRYTTQKRTNQRQWTHWVHKTQDTIDSGNMGYT